jgi:hypothetical protein
VNGRLSNTKVGTFDLVRLEAVGDSLRCRENEQSTKGSDNGRKERHASLWPKSAELSVVTRSSSYLGYAGRAAGADDRRTIGRPMCRAADERLNLFAPSTTQMASDDDGIRK